MLLGHVFDHPPQSAAELRQLLRLQVAIALLPREQQGLDVTVHQIGTVFAAGADCGEDFAQIVGDEGDEIEAHGGADVADAVALLVGGIAPGGVVVVRLALPDQLAELGELPVEPLAEAGLELLDHLVRALDRLLARHAAGPARQLFEAAVDGENPCVRLLLVVLHQSCPLRAMLRRLSISLCDKAGPASSPTTRSWSPLRRPTPLG